jgi:Coenzyme PQQ synthesis protein D (PqqD)
LGGESVILALKAGVYFEMNPLGTFIWDLIQKPVKLKEVRDRIVEEYQVEPDQFERDLLDWMKTLLANGLIECTDEKGALFSKTAFAGKEAIDKGVVARLGSKMRFAAPSFPKDADFDQTGSDQAGTDFIHPESVARGDGDRREKCAPGHLPGAGPWTGKPFWLALDMKRSCVSGY